MLTTSYSALLFLLATTIYLTVMLTLLIRKQRDKKNELDLKLFTYTDELGRKFTGIQKSKLFTDSCVMIFDFPDKSRQTINMKHPEHGGIVEYQEVNE